MFTAILALVVLAVITVKAAKAMGRAHDRHLDAKYGK